MNYTLFTLSWFETILAGISVLAIYSFLYRENKFYRLFEHLFIGISTAIVTIEPIKTFFWQTTLKPLLGLDRLAFPDGTYVADYDFNYLLFLIPIFFGSLYYSILVPKYSWLAQITIGFLLGISGGMAFNATMVEVTPQIIDSFRPLYINLPEQSARENLINSLNNIFFLIVLFSTSCYFFFTFKRKPNGVVEKISTSGRWLMMGCFGAFFGTTIMARLALLIERLQFMVDHWWVAVMALF
ncbi:MAG: hypothetical protein LBE20_01945 [Deltaproteobacteria bacterium]|jgi:hypothetical protein|nr:hypothetical protein [Deltaproteobacteria bacterium]